MDINIMPRWKCQKVVRAAKITGTQEDDEGTMTLVLEIDGAAMIQVMSAEYRLQHRPKVGGYLVIYEDGYESFSPGAPFEAGYTRIES